MATFVFVYRASRFCKRDPEIVALIGLLMLLVSMTILLHYVNKGRRTAEHYYIRLDVNKCPACYGRDNCSLFNQTSADHQLQLLPESHLADARNVYYATFLGQKVVLKKLAQNWELQKFDEMVLQLGAENDSHSNDVGSTLASLVAETQRDGADVDANTYRLLRRAQSAMAAADLGADAIHCHNMRFFRLALQKYTANGVNKMGSDVDGTSHLLTSLLINAEPVIMRVFSESSLKDRFPKYLGSCGRVIVEEYVGYTLDHFGKAPWPRRLRWATDLLHFAGQMTSNTLDLNLYWTDVRFENFAVTPSDRIVLLDVEGIVIVDANSTDHPDGAIHSNQFGNDDAGEGLKFSLDDLCSHRTADHNIYAICKCLLSDNPCSSGTSGGLLWGTSEAIERRWNLEALVKQCISGPDRFAVSEKLITTMEAITESLNGNVDS